MNIIIKNTNKYDLNFFNWLIEKIKSYLLMFDDFSRYKQIEEYINSNILRSKKYRYLTMHDIFFIAAASYECINYGSTAIIQINPQIKIYNTNIKVIDICKILNYGSISVKGIDIFSQIANHIKLNLNNYYREYCRGLS